MKAFTVILAIWTALLSVWVFALEDRVVALEFQCAQNGREMLQLRLDLAKEKKDLKKSAAREKRLEAAFVALLEVLQDADGDDKPSSYDKTFNRLPLANDLRCDLGLNGCLVAEGNVW